MSLMNYISMLQSEGRTFHYRENKRLAEALERKLFLDQKDQVQLTSLAEGVVDPDQAEKVSILRKRLAQGFGYDEHSAGQILQEVAGIMARTGEENAGDCEGAEAAA